MQAITAWPCFSFKLDQTHIAEGGLELTDLFASASRVQGLSVCHHCPAPRVAFCKDMFVTATEMKRKRSHLFHTLRYIRHRGCGCLHDSNHVVIKSIVKPGDGGIVTINDLG